MTPALLALALSLSAPSLKDPPRPEPSLVGRWASQGQPGLEYEFTPAGGWVIYQDGRVLDATVRTYRLNKEAGSGGIDLSERDPGYPGVYKVEGDRLSIAFRHSGAGRPATADATGDGILTLVFTRVTKD